MFHAMKNALWSMYINGLIIVLKKIKSRWDHKTNSRERESRRRREKERNGTIKTEIKKG